ncbi:MAG: carbohydrate porin [Myxococcota bacterium]|nr:carbohydrate porin [Myxococcota bacterium]
MKNLLIPAVFLLAFSSASAEEAFTFGSYGRIGVHTNDDGGQPLPVQVTQFGPRLLLGNYLEVDFGWKGWQSKEAKVRIVTTLSLGNRFAHYDGDFDTGVGIRQAFVEAVDLWETPVYLLFGSRMARGDDIYLLNFWPLDNLNIVGGAVGYRTRRFQVEAITGLNRVFDGYQIQRVAVPAIDFGAAEVEALNRQRFINALKIGQEFGGQGETLGMKWRLYSELHYLAEGERALDGSYTEKESLPDDRGWLVGAQFGLWNFGQRGHLNLWLRYANGLGAFDELQRPMGLNSERRVDGTTEFRAAASGNLEVGQFAVMAGGYYRYFKDADPNEVDYDDGNEGAISTRLLWLSGLFTPGIEVSTQVRRPNGLNPRTRAQRTSQVTEIALIPALSFGDNPGSYTRPQLRFVAEWTLLNRGAREQYPEDDPRAHTDTAFFAGLQAEWWFGRGGGY